MYEYTAEEAGFSEINLLTKIKLNNVTVILFILQP